jgi:hypothetical protein
VAPSRGIAARTVSALRRRMLVPPASGAECARALRRAGFSIRPIGSDAVVAERDGATVVTIPLVDWLRPELLVVILRTAGVSPAEFTGYLEDD